MKKNKTSPAAPVMTLMALPTLENAKVWHIPVRDITPSPFQPRKEFPAEEMEDLKQSVAANGIRIPLLGRRLDPDRDAVELIAGERRFRTAQALALETVPMIVQQLTDDEVVRIQRLENAGRENLKALEAAEDYVLLQSRGKTVEEICTLHGVKRSHVFTRMRVAKLPDSIKELIKDGKLSITVADLIAKLPTEKLQQEVVEVATEPDWQNELPSFRDMKAIIDEDYTRNLSVAPWLQGKQSSDVNLVEGVGPCATCPKRSGNIDGAEGSANVCTDVECYKVKESAWTKHLHATAIGRGHRVIDPEKYNRTSYQFERADDECQEDKKGRKWSELAELAQIKPAVTVSAGKMLEVFTKEDRAAIVAAHKLKREDAHKPSKEQLERDAKWKAEKDAIKQAKLAALTAACADLDAAGKKPLPITFWRKLATMVLEREADMMCGIDEEWLTSRGMKWEDDDKKDKTQLQEYIQRQQTPHNLIAFIVAMQLDTVTANGPAVLEPWGVDWRQFLPKAQQPKPCKQLEHVWEKTDLVSGTKTNYRCTTCGLKAVRLGVEWPPSTPAKTKFCPGAATSGAVERRSTR